MNLPPLLLPKGQDNTKWKNSRWLAFLATVVQGDLKRNTKARDKIPFVCLEAIKVHFFQGVDKHWEYHHGLQSALL